MLGEPGAIRVTTGSSGRAVTWWHVVKLSVCTKAWTQAMSRVSMDDGKVVVIRG